MSKGKAILLAVVGLAVIAGLYLAIDRIWAVVGIDWKKTFYPAARAVLQGQSPYTVPTFRNVPWTLLPLLPFALLPERVSGVLFFIATIGVYAWSAYRLQASRLALLVFLLSPPVIYGLRMLNVDILVLLGFSLPAPIGLFFVTIKPQMGLAMSLFWLAQAFRQGGLKQAIRTFAPVILALALSFLLFGNWLKGRQADLPDSIWDASLWPWAIPIGLVLLALALRDLREDCAMAASPFLSPYLAYHSWAGALAGLLRRDFELVLAVAGMWIVAILRAVGLG